MEGVQTENVKQEETKIKTEDNGRKALTAKERLEICQATERQRLAFCKVSYPSYFLLLLT